MKATQVLRDLGQSLWLDNITRSLLRTGVLRRYVDELSVTGLTSNQEQLQSCDDHALIRWTASQGDGVFGSDSLKKE